MAEASANATSGAVIVVHRSELPVCCPSGNVDAAGIHPRVYIPLEEAGGTAVCPYCGTEYQLQD